MLTSPVSDRLRDGLQRNAAHPLDTEHRAARGYPGLSVAAIETLAGPKLVAAGRSCGTMTVVTLSDERTATAHPPTAPDRFS
jgi:hypothetical protein